MNDGSMDEQSTALSLQSGLEKIGYVEHFTFHDGKMWSAESGKTYGPESLAIDAIFRFEGMSDPDNLSVIYALNTFEGTKGLLIDAYGTYGTPALSEFLRKVEDRRAEADLLEKYPLARRHALPAAPKRTPRRGPPGDLPDSQG